MRNVPFDVAECCDDRLPVVHCERVPDQKMSNRVDVSPNGVRAQLERLAHRRAAPHERVEDD